MILKTGLYSNPSYECLYENVNISVYILSSNLVTSDIAKDAMGTTAYC